MSQFLDFTIVSPNSFLVQDYPKEHLNWIQQDNFDVATEKHIIYLFLSKYDDLIGPSVLQQVNETFVQNPEISCVYTDQLVKKEGYDKIIYHPSNIEGPIVNAPLFIKGVVQPKFNSGLQYLYFYDMFRQLKPVTITWHIAKPLIQSILPEPFIIQQDLYKLQQNEQPSIS